VDVCHVADQRAVGQESDVHGREGQESMQDIVIGSANSHDRWDLPSPKREPIGIDRTQLVADRGNMMEQPQIFEREELRGGGRIDVQTREREHSGLLPLPNLGLDLGCPHEVWLVRAGRSVIGKRHVIVRAANLVLGAVAALREVLVTPDMSALAGFASLSRLGVAPSWRTTAGTSHWEKRLRETV
jgi:hypothetical protein